MLIIILTIGIYTSWGLAQRILHIYSIWSKTEKSTKPHKLSMIETVIQAASHKSQQELAGFQFWLSCDEADRVEITSSLHFCCGILTWAETWQGHKTPVHHRGQKRWQPERGLWQLQQRAIGKWGQHRHGSEGWVPQGTCVMLQKNKQTTSKQTITKNSMKDSQD